MHYSPKNRLLALMVFGLTGSFIGATLATGQGLTYVDANPDFQLPLPVTFGPNANIAPPAAFSGISNSNTDGLWGFREFFGAETPGAPSAFIFESSGTGGAEDAPEITQTITGLTSGNSYDVYAVYWSSNDREWAIRTGTSSGSLQTYDRTGAAAGAIAGTPAGSAIWATAPTSSSSLIFTEADRTMYLGLAGSVVADINGNATVFIDDLPATFDGNRTWFDGVAFTNAGSVLNVEANIDRDMGTLTLSNNVGLPVSFTAVSITSQASALDSNEWLSIANNYDGDDGAENDSDIWNVIEPNPLTSFAATLSEEEDASGSGGATMANGTSIDLGNVWIDSPYEDIQIQITLDNGSTATITPSYSGDAHKLGDFSGNNSVGLEDFQLLITNLHTDVSALSPAETYSLGDINGDQLINFTDFRDFRAEFIAGGGSLAALSSIPEPNSILLAAMGILVLFSRRTVSAAQLN